jgi:hypothetical protein
MACELAVVVELVRHGGALRLGQARGDAAGARAAAVVTDLRPA